MCTRCERTGVSHSFLLDYGCFFTAPFPPLCNPNVSIIVYYAQYNFILYILFCDFFHLSVDKVNIISYYIN